MDNDFFEIKADYIILKVRVTTKASRNSIQGIKNGALAISVTTVPENGKANESVIKILSKTLKCAKTKISLINGEKNRDKIFRIDLHMKSSDIIERINYNEKSKSK